MSEFLWRSFAAVGLYGLAVPGLIAVHASTWEILGTGCLAGLVAAAVRIR